VSHVTTACESGERIGF